MNVLCLHGCGMSGLLFKKLCKPFIYKAERRNIRLIFPDASYNDQWYHRPLEIADIGKKLPTTDIKELTEPTMLYIDMLIEMYNISALLGFSQGGNVVDTYMHIGKNRNRIKCQVVMSSYSFFCADDTTVIVPNTMIVASPEDHIVSIDETRKIPHSVSVEHSKGHKVPTTSSKVRLIVDFLEKHILS